MQNNFQRESHHDEPQNINSNNLTSRNVPDCGQYKPVEVSQLLQSYPATDQSDQLQKLLHQIDTEIERVLQKIDQFNLKTSRQQEDFYQMQKLFSAHVKSQIHPASCSNVGDALLKNGKFVVSFIEIITRNEKRDFLKKYLYNYFYQLSNISTSKQYFELYKSKLFESAQAINKIQEKSGEIQRKKLLLSPQSSQNDINWSTKVERDTNSPKSGYLDSSNRNNSDKKLKKQFIRVHQQINQQHQRSEKASKNVKKSNDKRSKMTKLKVDRSNNDKNKNSAKKTITKSERKMETKSIQDIIQSNIKPKQQENQESSKLGTFYHYQINLNRKNQKSLNQVRRSARLSINKERKSIQSRRKSLRKSSAKKSASKSIKKQDKKTKKRNEQPASESQYTAESEDSQQQVSEIDWIKKHLKSLNIKDVQLYEDFKALTKNDQKITQLLRQMQNSQEATQSNKMKLNKSQSKKKQKSNKKPENQKTQVPNKDYKEISSSSQKDVIPQNDLQDNQASQKSRKMSEIKKQFKIQELPLTIDYVIDPDLNNHGIYVLLKLGRVTQIQMGTAYAVSPLTYGSRVNRKHIKQDLQKAKQLAGQYSDNIGYIPMNQQILQMVKKKKQQ